MANRIQLRRDTSTNWAAVNPILTQGEVGLELNTGKIKIGNGITAWNSLPYFSLSYSDITGSPNIPTDLSQLNNDVGFISFNAQGDLELPAKFPIQFTAQFDAAHYAGGGTFQGDGTVSLGVQLQGLGAQFQWLVDDPTFTTNRGYVGQQAFRYTEADHGITGVNVDILVEVMGPDLGTGLYSLQVAFSPAPGAADLAKIRSTDELIVSSGTKGWIFDVQGNIYLPTGGDIRDSTGTSVLGGGFSGNYNDLTNKPVIPEISKTQTAGSAVQTSSLNVTPSEISLIGTLDTGFGPNENTIGKVEVTPGQVNISSLDQDAPDVEYKSEVIVNYSSGVTIRNSPGPGAVQSWVFGNNGNLTLPNNSAIRVDGTNVEVGGMTNFNVEALGVANIYTNDGTYQWQFGDDGVFYGPLMGGLRVAGYIDSVKGNGLTIAPGQPADTTVTVQPTNTNGPTGVVFVDLTVSPEAANIPVGAVFHVDGNPANDLTVTNSAAGNPGEWNLSLSGLFGVIQGDPYIVTYPGTNYNSVYVNTNAGSWEFKGDGSVIYPGDITQSNKDNTFCPPSVETVIYTSTGQYQHALKLFVMVEGSQGAQWETQACDVIAVKGYVNNIVHVTAYGVTYSGATPLATFDGRWNATTNRIEITCLPTSTFSVTASVHAIEMNSND